MGENNKLERIISDVDELIKKEVTADNPEFDGWYVKAVRFIIEKFGEDSFEMDRFKKISFHTSRCLKGDSHSELIDACRRGLEEAKAILKAYAVDFEYEQNIAAGKTNVDKNVDYNSVFIVHGHDDALKNAVARILETQKIKVIILSEQTNRGKTIIEKFEEHADVPCAICLFTKDDIVIEKNGSSELFRARQNVVFETGYFMGKIGRDKVIILSDSDIDMPSDLGGIVYTRYGEWKTSVLRELKDIGYNIDMNQ